jgi:predicted dehydrogenase
LQDQSYSVYALQAPDKCKVVAIAEPRPKTQKKFAAAHKVDGTLVFNTWQELQAASSETIKTTGKRLADAVIVSVLDHLHMEVVLAFAEQGYHILCEKPMATSIDDCIKMEQAVKKAGIIFGMGHGNYRFLLKLDFTVLLILQSFDTLHTIKQSPK